jgi:DNA polymerase V
MLTVFISKNRFGTEPPPYSFSTTLHLPVVTSDTAELIRYARAALKRLWLPNTQYKKTGVVFDGLETDGQQQLSLFEPRPRPNSGRDLWLSWISSMSGMVAEPWDLP